MAQSLGAFAPNTPGGDTTITSDEIYYRVDNRLGNLYQMDSLAAVYGHKTPADERFLKKYRRRMFEKRTRQVNGNFVAYDSLASRFLAVNSLAPVCASTTVPVTTSKCYT